MKTDDNSPSIFTSGPRPGEAPMYGIQGDVDESQMTLLFTLPRPLDGETVFWQVEVNSEGVIHLNEMDGGRATTRATHAPFD